MTTEYRVTGSLQKSGGKKAKRSKNYHAAINIPDLRQGKNGKSRIRWVSTRQSRKPAAQTVLQCFICILQDAYDANPLTDLFNIDLSSAFITTPINEEIGPETIDDPTHIDIDDADEPSEEPFWVLLMNWKDAFEKIENSTKEGYEGNFKRHIIPYFKKEHPDLKVSEVKRRHIQKYVNYEGKRRQSRVSVAKYVSNINKVLDYAVDEEWIEINPCQRIKYSLKFFSNVEFEPKYLGLKSIIRLLNKTMLSPDLEVGSDKDGFLWAFVTGIVFAVFYALRRGEIYGLRWADIDMDNDIIYIQNNIVRVTSVHEKKPKNKASCCSMPLLPIVKEFLVRLQQHQLLCEKMYGQAYTKNDYVLKRSDGLQPGLDYLNGRLKDTLVLLHESTIVTLHQLRHSTATLLRSIGMEDSTIQSWLRHADIQSTMHYAHDDGLTVKLIAGEQMNNIFVLEPKTKIETTIGIDEALKQAV